jgi:DNA-binding response OmpR family regulator
MKLPSSTTTVKSKYRLGDMELSPDFYTISCGEIKCTLTPIEFKLISFFFEREGKLLERKMLFQSIWEAPQRKGDRRIDIHISALRKKMTLIGSRVRIHVVRGVGYRVDYISAVS